MTEAFQEWGAFFINIGDRAKHLLLLLLQIILAQMKESIGVVLEEIWLAYAGGKSG
jgi:hypothetical protein